MLMRYPKHIKAGSKIGQMVMNVDMAPTMLDLVGVAAPQRSAGPLNPAVIQKEREKLKDGVPLGVFMEPQYRVPSWQAVRNERWKYVHFTELQGMDELYDLKSDPGEMKSLIFDAASTLAGLKKALDKFNQAIQ